MASQSRRSWGALLMFVLLGVDLGMNSSFDYDPMRLSSHGASDFLVVVVGIQIVVEISVFLTLFLAMTETFLFRVGLLGLLLKKFRAVLLVHPLYLAFTVAAGALRVRRLSNDEDGSGLVDLWGDDAFIAVSTIHKLVAVLYYVVNMRAIVKLGSRVYSDRSLWVSLVNQSKKQEGVI